MTPEEKKAVAAIFAANPDTDHVLSTGDGNFFLPKAIDHARYHANANGLKVEKILRDGKSQSQQIIPERGASPDEDSAPAQAGAAGEAPSGESEGADNASTESQGENGAAPVAAAPAKKTTPKKK
ncbi:MAG: hypothetical protein ACK4GL_12650 [Flavobacteriales bacterium]